MKKIRTNVFETNSSSCHSLVVAETPNFNYTIIPDKDGLITLDGDSYGGGDGKEYTDALTKANYVATSVVMGRGYHDESETEFDPDLATKEQLEDFYIARAHDSENARRLVNIIKKHTKAKCVHLIPKKYNVYIDHDSAGLGIDFMRDHTDEEVKNLLFNSESVLTLDYNG